MKRVCLLHPNCSVCGSSAIPELAHDSTIEQYKGQKLKHHLTLVPIRVASTALVFV